MNPCLKLTCYITYSKQRMIRTNIRGLQKKTLSYDWSHMESVIIDTLGKWGDVEAPVRPDAPHPCKCRWPYVDTLSYKFFKRHEVGRIKWCWGKGQKVEGGTVGGFDQNAACECLGVKLKWRYKMARKSEWTHALCLGSQCPLFDTTQGIWLWMLQFTIKNPLTLRLAKN